MNYKNKANITLLCVFLVFIVTLFLRYFYGNIFIFNFLFIVMEASLVGGIADWFAITAIFSKPLGISYHTELIPRNRKKIILGISNMVEKELLTSEVINKRISQVKVIDKLIIFIENKKYSILKYVEKYINDYISNHGKDTLIYIYNNLIEKHIEKFSITDNIKLLIKEIENNQSEEKIIDFIIDGAIKICERERTKDFIYSKLVELKEKKINNFFSKLSFSIFEKTDSVNFLSAASSIQNGIIDSFLEMKNKDSDMRRMLKEQFRECISNIEYHREGIEEFKIKLIRELDIRSIAFNNLDENNKQTSILCKWILLQMKFCFKYFVRNEDLKKSAENILKNIICSFAEKEHRFIGTIVTETLNEFDDKKLNEFVEHKFGNDLQWIRINGSVVGGIIGALMFIFLTFIYDPYIVPIIRNTL
ncbi:hypothetical protein CPAST_c26090 [Clostridium pasteurianum DSM 525 = ATCC 6013]|uniref:DUF445 domain-containing protein n=2 Tax=Clostridium pasteurianum TaxID=1501 RepID=A0A0H3J676_CLOPA|nr:DUF445 domain-containing protein [Clostridium pasteurianum]AJA48677.1 hypothetical protein CPAST_c26090 [Clostridium pasteurianum DSM 525 = ATCC 6013]AJA52665.1 hypothetical protein CLPA_c26090 [Clostridium pasteurianum DSM 525 = ATCC 6013]AOZ75903.1 hypothetical protein AQ983_12675 [Clostridium pasteurianum DSM 525 = ATCC 6013]AOZ79699.1 hypothetical protein AQ984_12670 [Clostridium pasteurianum]ELP59976.1 hypothetical protein F502_05052 [Clostridium pasteurianum DSM 525 = ATCC 6013]